MSLQTPEEAPWKDDHQGEGSGWQLQLALERQPVAQMRVTSNTVAFLWVSKPGPPGLQRGSEGSPSRCPGVSPTDTASWTVLVPPELPAAPRSWRVKDLAPGRQQLVFKNSRSWVKTGEKKPKKDANFLLAKLSSKSCVFLFLVMFLFRQNHLSSVSVYRRRKITGFSYKKHFLLFRDICAVSQLLEGKKKCSFCCCLTKFFFN